MSRRTGCLIAIIVAVAAVLIFMFSADQAMVGQADQNNVGLPMPVPSARPTADAGTDLATPAANPSKSAAASPVFCAAIEEPASPEDCARFEQLRGRLADGAAAFNAPATVKRGDTVRIRLAADRDATSSAPADAVDALSGDTVRIQTKVGRYMRAELSGDGFRIAALTPAAQDLFTSNAAVWEWDATAVTGGRHVLSLKTWVETRGPDGTMRPRWLKVEDRPVTVAVTWPMRLSDGVEATVGWLGRGTNLLKALAALIVAAGGLWLAIRQFGKPPKD